MNNPDTPQSFRSVVFATDFSATAQVAGQYAARLAQHYDAELIVAHAFTLEQYAMEAEELGQVRSTQREQLDHLLAETIKELGRFATRTASVLSEGRPNKVIERVAQEHRPTLIVLGTHGGGAMARHVVGSVAEGILRTVGDPVLTVGPHVAPPSADRLAFRHILYATDFSASAAQAAAYAFALARTFGSELDVLHVVPKDDAEQRDLLTRKEMEFLATLREPATESSQALPRSRTFVESGKARERILDHARQHGVDLIILGAHHHSYLALHLRTGPAFQVILHATCPVLTVCARE